MFKIGDQVKYIDPAESLLFKRSALYTVNLIRVHPASTLYTIQAMSFKETNGFYAMSRFELVVNEISYPTLRSGYVVV